MHLYGNQSVRMKPFRTLLLVGALFACAAKAPFDDAALTRQLVGTWTNDPAQAGPVVSTTTYNLDGTGVETVRLSSQPESDGVRVTTEWSVKDGVLILKSVASSDPQRIPAGIELKDRILSISNDRFVFETCDGYGGNKGRQGVKVRTTVAALRLP